MTLYKQFFRAQRTGLLIWTLSGMWVAWLMASTTKATDLGDILTGLVGKLVERLPEGLQVLFGMVPGLSPIDSLIQAKIGLSMGLMLPMYGALMMIAAILREVDRGTADFLLSLPVERRKVLVSRWCVMVTNTLIVALATWGTLVLGMRFAGSQGNFVGYFWMIMQGWLMGLAFSSMAMLASLFMRDYASAVKLAMAVIWIMYFLDFGFTIAGVPRKWRLLNLFTYLNTVKTVQTTSLVYGDAAVFLAIVVVCVGLSIRYFEKKEILA